MKGIIIYKGKYGATRQYALWLGEMLHIPFITAGDETKPQLEDADYIIMGTSIYIGKLQLRKWLKIHQEVLVNKRLFLFLVAGTPPSEQEKLQGYIEANISIEIRNCCSFFFLPGKLEFSKLSLIDKLLLKIGSRLSKSKGEVISVTDYNNVTKEALLPMLEAISKKEGAVI